ncbi:MAG: right-handed parallel beta-helix repeat-containing protein [Deltaproteobacteria bacterium]|nr:right-handed parallel beta-helix repeat-containing protein [Deltaproteobacteria bacterium]
MLVMACGCARQGFAPLDAGYDGGDIPDSMRFGDGAWDAARDADLFADQDSTSDVNVKDVRPDVSADGRSPDMTVDVRSPDMTVDVLSPDLTSPFPINAVFISPSGSDTNAGTQIQPWKTWSFALSQLGPGDTLVALSGIYGAASGTGYLRVDCDTGATACAGGPCLNGTSGNPITVMAYPERSALVQGEAGAGAPLIYLDTCSYWNLVGLRAEDVDDSSVSGSSVIKVKTCDQITLRRMLAARPNRYGSHSAFAVDYSTNVLVEECEAYDFHRAGISVYRASELTIRRNYLNARLRQNLSDGHIAVCNSPGIDAISRGIYLFGASHSIIENNVAEEICIGVGVYVSGGNGDDNEIVGNMVLGTFRTGYGLSSDCNDASPCTDPDRIVERDHFTDNLAVGGVWGYYFRGGTDIEVAHASSINYSGVGCRFDEVPENAGLASNVAIATSLAVTSTGNEGFVVIDQSAWSLTDCNAFGNLGTNYRTDGPPGASYDPQLGGCRVYIPMGSPGKGAADDGSDIGATIVFRTEDGALTGEKLWDATTGAFPCGLPVPGLSDDTGFPDSACINVHRRLHVGTSGCPIP